jgi:hypothetical protein
MEGSLAPASARTHAIAQLTASNKIFPRTRQKNSEKVPWWWPVLAALALLAGCAAGEPQQSTPPNAQPVAQAAPTAESTAAQQSGLTGLWEGTSTSSCMPFQPDIGRCNAVVKITLNIFQQGSTLTGRYTCTIGNMVCRDSNTTGTIADGKVRDGAAALRVMLPDGSSCLFNGRPSNNTMTGSYFCMQGGGYIEQGRFQVQRNY